MAWTCVEQKKGYFEKGIGIETTKKNLEKANRGRDDQDWIKEGRCFELSDVARGRTIAEVIWPLP